MTETHEAAWKKADPAYGFTAHLPGVDFDEAKGRMNEGLLEHRPRPRPEPRVAQPILAFDLAGELLRLRSEPSWQHGHNATTLVKRPDSNIVLTLLRAGQKIKNHAVESSVSIQVLSGSVRVTVGGGSVPLATGGLLLLAPGLAHDLEALEEASLLLHY